MARRWRLVLAVGPGCSMPISVKSKTQAAIRSILSNSAAVNRLSAARLFLFASRDIWFVVALPSSWTTSSAGRSKGIGGFLAAWVIGYGSGAVPGAALRPASDQGGEDEAAVARRWVFALGSDRLIAAGSLLDVAPRTIAMVGGLVVFGVVFARELVAPLVPDPGLCDRDEVVARCRLLLLGQRAGRLLGTLLSGVLYLIGGLPVAMVGSTLAVAVAWFLSLRLPAVPAARSGPRPAATVADVVAS